MKTIFITGASSGIGAQTALYFARKGYGVVATSRSVDKLKEGCSHENIKHYALDVTKSAEIHEMVPKIWAENPGIEMVFNNAGHGLLAPFEMTTEKQVHEMFYTHVFGSMEVTRAFLPFFKKQKSGMFLYTTSIGGLVTMPLNSVYHAAKYAVEGFAEGLIYEVQDFGISVRIIEPGAVKTNFGQIAVEGIQDKTYEKDYAHMIQSTKDAFQNSYDHAYLTPEQVAEVVYEAATSPNGKLRNIVGQAAQDLFKMKNSLSPEEYIEKISQRFLKKS